MIPGQEYQVTVKISKISKSSFNMHYEFRNEQKKLCVRAQVVHVFVDPTSMQKTAFPDKYLKILEKYCLPDANDFNFNETNS
jgi:acyl-CoA thioesterase FadM